MLIFPSLFGNPFYFKAEDIHYVVKLKRKIEASILIVSAVIFGVMQLMITPRMLLLYRNLQVIPPQEVKLTASAAVVVMTAMFVFAIYLLWSQPNYNKMKIVANKYKQGDLINITQLLDGRILIILGLSLVVIFSYSYLTVLVPFYILAKHI